MKKGLFACLAVALALATGLASASPPMDVNIVSNLTKSGNGFNTGNDTVVGAKAVRQAYQQVAIAPAAGITNRNGGVKFASDKGLGLKLGWGSTVGLVDSSPPPEFVRTFLNYSTGTGDIVYHKYLGAAWHGIVAGARLNST